jgi:NADPH:quinone reductase-like Zn-dependent oxidoreductase
LNQENTMRALTVLEAGAQPVVADITTPEAGPGTVLVKIKAASLNAVDAAIAGGMLAGMMPHEYPLVIGRDAAGVVEAIGAGVEGIAVGDAVIGAVTFAPPIQAGTIAEYAAFPVAVTTPKPAGLSFEAAASLPIAGATAVAAVDAVSPQRGDVVLVTGAAGGVGSFVVQLLAQRGATVLATGRATDAARLTGLGAAQVLDYTTGSLVDQVLAAYPDGMDALVDLANHAPEDLPLGAVRGGGKVASALGAAQGELLESRGLTGFNVGANPVRAVVGPLAAAAAAGTLKVDVSTVLTLDDAASGLQIFGAGHSRGKTVIHVAD